MVEVEYMRQNLSLLNVLDSAVQSSIRRTDFSAVAQEMEAYEASHLGVSRRETHEVVTIREGHTF